MLIRSATIPDLPYIMKVAKFLIGEIGYINPAALREAIGREQLLVDADSWSFCHYRTRRDGMSVIYEIAVPMRYRGKGIGRALLNPVPRPIQLKCPADNASNRFYERLGFTLLGVERGKKKPLNVWRLET